MSEENNQEEYEEITSEEVDRIVARLEALIESTDSENIRSYLEEAMNEIYYLVYEEGDEEWDSEVEACGEDDEDLSEAA
ncbi:hypothetical protein [Gimesia sp.]|uniref:hypothetical protein n=1 Tax=Gimesia sp. TaxID=2024833 RepID=UPI000C3FE9F5|nr:hypothetical protein [Gimesia sp.]MAX36086.1 hypothetical protein [Gimesia sp.]HAH49635.1 hypothetical protein [Planctomycetaceae bacterium]HBL46334.1 hypothetical protein [Planctomycetaceae bacterium]